MAPRITLFLLLLLSLNSVSIAQDNVGEESTVKYPASYFGEWSPVTAQDMLDRIPGLSGGSSFGSSGGSSRGGRGGSSIMAFPQTDFLVLPTVKVCSLRYRYVRSGHVDGPKYSAPR